MVILSLMTTFFGPIIVRMAKARLDEIRGAANAEPKEAAPAQAV